MAPSALIVEVDGVKHRLGPQRALPLSPDGVATPAVSGPVTGGATLMLLGWSARETTGAAAASFDLYDGSSAGGAPLGVQNLASGASETVLFETPGILLATGKVYLQVVSGSLAGVVYVRMEE